MNEWNDDTKISCYKSQECQFGACLSSDSTWDRIVVLKKALSPSWRRSITTSFKTDA